jgi:uncharacterized protein (TIGR00159 family)
VGANLLKLATLRGLLSSLLSSIVLIVVVVFQNDIRRALIRMGNTTWFSVGREQQSRVIDEVVAAATELARHRMGALIAFEQDANVLEFTKSEGIHLDCVVTRELLVSLFVPESVNKLHDGAVLIRDLRIARAGMFFPMPDTKILDAQLGSRHRAALGITEETDAVVVVVSEERGTISFCFSGNIVSNLDGPSLRQALLGLFGRAVRNKGAVKKAPAGPPSAQVRPPVGPAITATLRPVSSLAPAQAPSAPAKLIAPVMMKPTSDARSMSNTMSNASSNTTASTTSNRDVDLAPLSTTTPSARLSATFVPSPTVKRLDETPPPGDDES